MLKKLKGFKYLWLMAALAAALTIAGCSNDSPLAPDTDLNTGLNKTLSFLQVVEGPAMEEAVEAEEVIYSRPGGSVEVTHDSFKHALIVEPYGLSAATTISVVYQKEEVRGRQAGVFEFGPSGTVFNTPSKLVYQMTDLNPFARTAKLYYYDPRVGDWVLRAERLVEGGVVEFEISHFSKYAISD